VTSVQFYAAEEDHRYILDLVFAGKHTFRVFESRSDVDTDLREFTSAADVLAHWNPPRRSRSVALLAAGAAPAPTFTRVDLRGNNRRGSFDYRCEGWGLIHLQVSGVHRGRLEPSRLAHNSEKRAIGWADTIDRLPGPQTWDWAAVTSASGWLVRQIRKAAVGQDGAWPVLRGAATVMAALAHAPVVDEGGRNDA
jgi:hypothetical protein